MKIFDEVIQRYMRLGSGQFLKDFRRDYNLKKTLAHRKAVLARKEKDQERQLKVQIKAIEEDRSSSKRASHLRLVALIKQIHEKGIVKLYTKAELKQLCGAYDVNIKAKWNKSQLVKELTSKIIECTEMPCHGLMSNYTVEEIVRSDNAAPSRLPVLRFHRL